MKFTISKEYIDKRRRSPLFVACIIVVITTSAYLLGDWTFSGVFTFTILMLAFTVLPNWVGAKRHIEGARNHYIEVCDSSILSYGEGYKSETELGLVNSIVLNKNRSGIKSIILKADKRLIARLENYENIDELANLIMETIPNAKVTEKRWIHS
ncbi:hypothetical protein [Agarivorans aestuarii]|uniref:hypothetical protein n=1 Tax=Agarivorans aestuarii TaxID=1563703 RepID=UPI001C825A12|nr:hypothetical protein [Agarivorans aestuarii]